MIFTVDVSRQSDLVHGAYSSRPELKELLKHIKYLSTTTFMLTR